VRIILSGWYSTAYYYAVKGSRLVLERIIVYNMYQVLLEVVIISNSSK
jgi:hypothetical protein